MNVTVVIPTLNERENLPVCLDRLRVQLDSGDNVIIVDGGSDDGTKDIARNHGCSILVASDSSIGTARNIGSKMAENPIVISMDADSIPPNGYIDRVKQHFENDDDLVVLYGSIKDRNGVPIRNLAGKFSTLFRGASGNNTAFRRDVFEDMEGGYADVNFAEDYFIINKLAKMGKSKRDKGLVMVMNMDRSRYQTKPILTGGLISSVVGFALDGRIGDILLGAGAGAVVTELLYEDFTGSPMHHDELGFSAIAAGLSSNIAYSDKITGVGGGLVVHHVLTEGLSLAPTDLAKHTDEIIMGGGD